MSRNCAKSTAAKLFLAGLALLFSRVMLCQKATSPAAVTTVTPNLVISFERQTIRENDRIPVHVILSNPSDKALSDLTLSWDILSNRSRALCTVTDGGVIHG